MTKDVDTTNRSVAVLKLCLLTSLANPTWEFEEVCVREALRIQSFLIIKALSVKITKMGTKIDPNKRNNVVHTMYTPVLFLFTSHSGSLPWTWTLVSTVNSTNVVHSAHRNAWSAISFRVLPGLLREARFNGFTTQMNLSTVKDVTRTAENNLQAWDRYELTTHQTGDVLVTGIPIQ